MKQLLYTVYSRYTTSPGDKMAENNYSMEMGDQLLTVRPRDMVCWLRFSSVET